jgi:hypothetical protein
MSSYGATAFNLYSPTAATAPVPVRPALPPPPLHLPLPPPRRRRLLPPPPAPPPSSPPPPRRGPEPTLATLGSWGTWCAAQATRRCTPKCSGTKQQHDNALHLRKRISIFFTWVSFNKFRGGGGGGGGRGRSIKVWRNNKTSEARYRGNNRD